MQPGQVELPPNLRAGPPVGQSHQRRDGHLHVHLNRPIARRSRRRNWSFPVGSAGFTEAEIWPLHPKEDVDLSKQRLDGLDAAESAAVALALQKDYAVLAPAG